MAALMITFCGCLVCMAVALGYRLGARATLDEVMEEIEDVRRMQQKMASAMLIQGEAVGELLREADRRCKNGSTDTRDRIG